MVKMFIQGIRFTSDVYKGQSKKNCIQECHKLKNCLVEQLSKDLYNWKKSTEKKKFFFALEYSNSIESIGLYLELYSLEGLH